VRNFFAQPAPETVAMSALRASVSQLAVSTPRYTVLTADSHWSVAR